VTPALWRLRQEDREFKASLRYIESPCLKEKAGPVAQVCNPRVEVGDLSGQKVLKTSFQPRKTGRSGTHLSSQLREAETGGHSPGPPEHKLETLFEN
jgi:hypothetical protein